MNPALSVFAALSVLMGANASTNIDKSKQSQAQNNTAGMSIAHLRTLDRIASSASRFGVPPLYFEIRFTPETDYENNGDEVLEAARFIRTKVLRPAENILITLEHTSDGRYTMYALQGEGWHDSNIDIRGPAKTIAFKEISETQFSNAIKLFKDFDVCSYPIDNDFGPDGEWRSVEYRFGDRYCFATRWSSNAAELSALGDALAKKLGISEKQ